MAAASTAKVVVLSGRAPAPYADASAATPPAAPSGFLRDGPSKPPQHSQQEQQRHVGVDERQQGMHGEKQVRNATGQGISSSAPSSGHVSEPAAAVPSMAPPCGEELCGRNDSAAEVMEAGSGSLARSPVQSAAAPAASQPASEESRARSQEDPEDARIGLPQGAPGVASVLESVAGGTNEDTQDRTRGGNATWEAAVAGARRPRHDNATADRWAAEDSAGFASEERSVGEAAAGCGVLVDGSRQPLTAKERVLQAAIDRLAEEDAEEELRRRDASAQEQEQGQEQGLLQQEEAVSSGGPGREDASCPAGFVCSDSVSVPIALNHRSTPAAPVQAEGSATMSPVPAVDGAHRGAGAAEDGAGHGRQDEARAAPAEWPHDVHETPEVLVENMEQAQEAARKRADLLREGRRMLAARSKLDDVAKRDQEMLRAARSKHEHPMFQRAVAAATALEQPPPAEPAAPAATSAAESGLRVAEAESDSLAPNGGASSPRGDMRVASSPPEHGSSPLAEEGHDSARGTEATPVMPPGAVKECGVGIGVGAAAHGTWKIKRVVPGDSVDRAIGSSSSTPLQVGDILTRVDGSSISGMSILELSKLVKGPHGSRVTVEFYSLSDSSLHTLTVDRECLI